MIYVAGPYVGGAGSEDTVINVRNAIRVGREILETRQAVPFVPHGFHFWHFLEPGPRELWIEGDLDYLPHCDALVRLPGASKGTDEEVRIMREELERPVFELEHPTLDKAVYGWITEQSNARLREHGFRPRGFRG